MDLHAQSDWPQPPPPASLPHPAAGVSGSHIPPHMPELAQQSEPAQPSEPVSAFDCEFLKVMTGLGSVDLVTLALEFARDAEPNLCFSATHYWLDDRADELADSVADSLQEADALSVVRAHLTTTAGLIGESRAVRDPRSLFPHHIIESRRGSPLGLALLFARVAEAVGLHVFVASAAPRLLVGCETVHGRLFVDFCGEGRILQENECLHWLARRTGATRERLADSLQPASPKTVALRLLNCLKAAYARAEAWSECYATQGRIVLLAACCPQERRDLATLAVMARRPEEAIPLLDICLEECPPGERSALLEYQKEAFRQLDWERD